jgi:hypothetical protein
VRLLRGRTVPTTYSLQPDETRDEAERNRYKQAASWLGSTASKIAIGALGGAGGRDWPKVIHQTV